MEKIKTILLGFLVVTSLVQSYFLTYYAPNVISLKKEEKRYVNPEILGPEERVENLIFPEQMVIHLGEGQHTLFQPNSTFYNLIYKRLQSRIFSGFKQNSMKYEDVDKMRNEKQGIELSFGRGMPFLILQKFWQLEENRELEEKNISTIWIFTKSDREEVETWFVTDEDEIFESVVNMSIEDLRQQAEVGNNWINYEIIDKRFYASVSDLVVAQIEMDFESFTTEQLKSNLFLDPSIMRNIQEKDGSQIFTDGKRSIEIRKEQRWMSYNDPVAPTDTTLDVSENVYSAVEFVNEHGGWNGSYALTLHPRQKGEFVFVFEQYYDSYRILSNEKFPFGYIKLLLQQGSVSTYERSLIQLREQNMAKKMVRLPGGEKLREMIRSYANREKIRSLFPAYQPSVRNSKLLLTPRWAVKLANGTTEYLKE